jgi:hypothetical protein
MISIFPLWTFHLYVATFQQHLPDDTIFQSLWFLSGFPCFVCFVDRCLSSCAFSFGHCVVCSSSIYGFWLPLWYLQALLISSYSCSNQAYPHETCSPTGFILCGHVLVKSIRWNTALLELNINQSIKLKKFSMNVKSTLNFVCVC